MLNRQCNTHRNASGGRVRVLRKFRNVQAKLIAKRSTNVFVQERTFCAKSFELTLSKLTYTGGLWQGNGFSAPSGNCKKEKAKSKCSQIREDEAPKSTSSLFDFNLEMARKLCKSEFSVLHAKLKQYSVITAKSPEIVNNESLKSMKECGARTPLTRISAMIVICIPQTIFNVVVLEIYLSYRAELREK